MTEGPAASERPVGQVRGTRDWLPGDHAAISRLETLLLDRFALAGYAPMRIPVLEPTELHERKSGAGIVSKLYEIGEGTCLRPELTAGIVRAYVDASEPPPLPWRVSMSGVVFRHEALRPGFDREFQQVGVEMLGASGPAADAEVIWLADWALKAAGIGDATIRIGHVGLILEMLARSGLPEAARAALVERLSEAAAEGGNVGALEAGLEQLTAWLGGGDEGPPIDGGSNPGVDRLFRTLVPDVTGRRSGREILHRLRQKWELGHSLHDVIYRLRDRVHELAGLHGPATAILNRLEADYAAIAPESIAALRSLVATLADYGVTADRIELDLGFGRGIGFYSRMVFELVVLTPDGPMEVCGGGRYDGLARVLGSNRDDRGVGFAFGLERLAEAVDRRNAKPRSIPPQADLVAPERPEFLTEAIRLATRLRSAGLGAILHGDRPSEESFEYAKRSGLARILWVAGPIDRPRSIVVEDLDGRSMTAASLEDLIPRSEAL